MRSSIQRTIGSPRRWLVFLALGVVFLSFFNGKKDPSQADSQLEFGVEMARRGLWSEALFRFKQVEQREPAHARNLNNIAVSYEALGQFDKALEYYQKAIKASPAEKDLKRNYSRFVEFYRNFKPEGEDVEDGGDGS